MIAINNMTYSWGKGKTLLNIKEWKMESDSCFIYGPSGCGKSSLVNLLSGITVAQSGRVCVLDEELSRMSNRKRDKFRANNLGVIYQQFNLLPYLTGLENILLAVKLASSKRPDLMEYINELLAKLKLSEEILSAKPMQLSIGQQQRLAIVRSLVNRPRLIIADEPTSALDSYSRDAFVETLLQECADSQCQLLFFSHDMSQCGKFSHSESLTDFNGVELDVHYAV